MVNEAWWSTMYVPCNALVTSTMGILHLVTTVLSCSRCSPETHDWCPVRIGRTSEVVRKEASLSVRSRHNLVGQITPRPFSRSMRCAVLLAL